MNRLIKVKIVRTNFTSKSILDFDPSKIKHKWVLQDINEWNFPKLHHERWSREPQSTKITTLELNG